MECDKNGRKRSLPAATGSRGFKRKCGVNGEGVMQLAFAAAVPSTSLERPVRNDLGPSCPSDLPTCTANVQPTDYPFMNNMDEISYWIYTKRAPCLFNYDNTVKKQVEQAHCSNAKPASVKSKHEEQPSPKKKRKLKLLDEDSVSTEKQQNIYFKTSQNQKTAPSSCKSDALGSVIDLNIKNPCVKKRPKKIKVQGNCQTTLHKKNKIVTSTPKVVNLRRSLRKAQQNINNNSHLNSSFEIFNTSVINGKQDVLQVEEESKLETVVHNDQLQSKVISTEKAKNEIVLNGQFEDLSDVSGFTANYIRSTKIHSSKTQRKLRTRNSRTLVKDTKQRVQHDEMIMCVNKSVNTGHTGAAILNCSTDSSQNVLNLVSVRNNERSNRVNKSTSMLKFMEIKLEGSISNNIVDVSESKNNLNVSFQSRSSGTSRYPKRHKNNTTKTPEQNCSNVNNLRVNSSGKKYNRRKGKLHSNAKGNSEEKIVSKTRSGRRIGMKLDLEESGCSMLQLNNSTEQASSSVAMNVACPKEKAPKIESSTSRCLRSRTRKEKSGQVYKDSASERSNEEQHDSMPCALAQTSPGSIRQVKKSMNKIRQSLNRDSSRYKSGFAACFSDSDSDSEPLRQRKFFFR